ncbi:MAG: 30S ribosomal protein S5 [Bdellovibrionales bacterium]|nr:30S ribosomal protein S5 [Bdellovibrionales bacterium]
MTQSDLYEKDLNERVIAINRVTKVVKGGRHFSFSALVVTGDGKGKVGVGMGKAGEVPESINKASRVAKKSLKKYNFLKGRTIPHEVTGHFGASKVILKPAAPGTGLIAGGPVRSILECAGVKDILSKRIGTRNPHNVVKATLQGLSQLLSQKIQDKQNKKEVV